MIIGITGTNGAGKGTVVDYLVKKKKFEHFSAREDVINKEILNRGLEITRDNMNLVANELREKHGSSYIAEKLFEIGRNKGKDCIIESVRTIGEIKALRKKGNFYLLAVDANQKIRYERILKRKNAQSDNVSFDKFKEQEAKEMSSKEPNKQNLSACIKLADWKLSNNSTIQDLYTQIDSIFKEILKDQKECDNSLKNT